MSLLVTNAGISFCTRHYYIYLTLTYCYLTLTLRYLILTLHNHFAVHSSAVYIPPPC